MVSESNTVLKIVAGKTDEPFSASVSSEKEIKRLTYRVTDKDGAIKVTGEAAPDSKECTFTASFAALAWSCESPNLYTLAAVLEYTDGTREELSDRFGFRYFSVDENYIYLNGYPFYMRAYIRGAAAHEHGNNCSLPEYDFYKKNFLAARSYGFNAVRFHSVVPPEECFRAADDLGMLIHIEMRREGKMYDNLREMLYGKDDLIENDELDAIIDRLYNHPSFMVYCVGNELRQPAKKPRIREIRDIIKKKDPTRLFLDTCAHGEYDRDYVDFDVQHMGYFFPYGRNADMFENTDNLLCFGTVRDIDMVADSEGSRIRRGISFPRPLIAHEICHYTSWRDYYALKEKFESYGKAAPWWVDEEIKMLEAKGYKDSFKKLLSLTKSHQTRLWKTALENLRASTLLSGFHMLQFADTDKYENSNGVVDCFDDPHGISADAFRAFNSDTVILARLPRQTYTSGECVKVPVLLSQYAINPARLGDFSYTLKRESGEIVRRGEMSELDTSRSGIYTICKLEFTLPVVSAPEKLVLTTTLSLSDGKKVENSWELWSFPQNEYPMPLSAASDMREDYLTRAVAFDKDAPVTVTDKLDDSLFKRLENGERVILIYRTDWTRHLLHKGMAAPKYSFRHTWERYKGVIWDRGTLNGGYDKGDILTRHGFVSDGELNFHYYNLVDDSDKINLDDFPVKVNSLVSGIDKAVRDRFDPKKFGEPELMYDRTMRNFSYAFSLKVGKGRLTVTGFNLTGIDRGDPASLAMLKALVSYTLSEDFSGGEITAEELRTYLSAVAAEGPQKERMMTQYWQLDEEPVESMEYWEESERYLRED